MDMSEIELLNKIRRLTLLYSGGDSIVSEKLKVLWERYESGEYVSGLLGGATRLNALSEVSKANAFDARQNVPLLPIINSYEDKEKQQLTKTSEDGLSADLIGLTYRIYPLAELADDEIDTVTTKYAMNNKNHDFNVAFTIVLNKSTQTYDISIVIKVKEIRTGQELKKIERNFALFEYEYLEVSVINSIDAITESFVPFQTVSDSETDQSVEVCDYSVSYVTTANVVISVVEARVSEEYVMPFVRTLDVNVYNGLASAKLMLDEYVISLDETSNGVVWDCVFADTYLETAISVEKLFDDYVKKIHASNFVNAFECQAAGYLSSSNAKLEIAQSASTFEADKVLTDVVQSLVAITNVLKRVSTWEKLAVEFDGGQTFGVMKSDMHFPIDIPKFKHDLTANNVHRDISVGKVGNDWATMDRIESVKIGMPSYKVSDIFKLGNFGEITIYAEVAFEYVLDATVENSLEPLSAERLINFTKLFDISTVGQTGTYTCRFDLNMAQPLPINSKKGVCRVMIKKILFIDPRATYAVGDITGDLTMKYGSIKTKNELKLTGLKSVELVTIDGTRYGVACDVNVVLENDFNYKTCLRFDSEETFSRNVIFPFIILNDGQFVFQGEKVQHIDVVTGYRPIETFYFTFLVGDRSIQYRYEINDSIYSDGSFQRADGENMNYTVGGESVRQCLGLTDSQLSTGIGVFFSALIQITGSLSYTRQIAPVDIGQQMYLSEYNTAQERINNQIMYDLSELEKKYVLLEQRVAVLEIELEKLRHLIDPPFYQILLNEVTSFLIGKATAYVLQKFMQVMWRSIGALSRAVKVVYANARFARKFLESSKLTGFDSRSNPVRLMYYNTVAIATNLKNAFRKSQAIKDTKFSSAIAKTQHLNLGDVLDINYKFYKNHNIVEAINDSRCNVLANMPSLPSMNVFYRPLGVLPKPFNKILHSNITAKSNLRKKLIYDSLNANTKLPSHSFFTYDNPIYKDGKTTRIERYFMGIGELNSRGVQSSDVKSGINGVRILYDTTKTLKNGKRILTPLSYTESGYTDKEVANLYKSLFKRDPKNIDPSAQWNLITIRINDKIVSSDMLYNTYLPDSSFRDVLQSMLRDPPQFQYNLIYNNCQNFTLDIINYLKYGISPSSWPLNIVSKYEGIRVKTIKGFLDDIESVAKDRVKRDLDNSDNDDFGSNFIITEVSDSNDENVFNDSLSYYKSLYGQNVSGRQYEKNAKIRNAKFSNDDVIAEINIGVKNAKFIVQVSRTPSA